MLTALSSQSDKGEDKSMLSIKSVSVSLREDFMHRKIIPRFPLVLKLKVRSTQGANLKA